jgi:aldose sugar dehydrogenase
VTGKAFTEWRGNLLVSALSAQAIIRVELEGTEAAEATRYEMGARIRSIIEGPNGALWALEDERGSSQGRLLKLLPR